MKKPQVEQYEVNASSEVKSESMKPSTTPVATIDAFSSQMALVNAGAGNQFKSPQTVFKIAPVQPELPQNPIQSSPTRGDARPPKRNRWIAILFAFLALMVLVTSVISTAVIIPHANSKHAISNAATQITTTISTKVQATIPIPTPNLTATA
ncbi:MAG: hypothetical protein ACXVBU_19450, partial [Ktedonobacteraceae bacterium]